MRRCLLVCVVCLSVPVYVLRVCVVFVVCVCVDLRSCLQAERRAEAAAAVALQLGEAEEARRVAASAEVHTYIEH